MARSAEPIGIPTPGAGEPHRRARGQEQRSEDREDDDGCGQAGVAGRRRRAHVQGGAPAHRRSCGRRRRTDGRRRLRGSLLLRAAGAVGSLLSRQLDRRGQALVVLLVIVGDRALGLLKLSRGELAGRDRLARARRVGLLDGQERIGAGARHRQGHIFEADLQRFVRNHTALAVLHPHTRRVQRHLGAIEIVPLERRLQHCRIGMAGDADKARHLLVAELQQNVEHAVARFHGG